MNYKQASVAHGDYLCGASLAKVAKRYGIARQSLHYYFKQFGLSTRPLKRMNKRPYNGSNYTINNSGYYRKTDGDRELLHRQIWQDHYGVIPKGYNVHHKDEIKTHNDLDNLELLRIDKHSSLHGFKNNQFTKINPDKYIYREKVVCLECNNSVPDNNRGPSYKESRIFCSRECKCAHMKGKPMGYSVRKIIGIITGKIK